MFKERGRKLLYRELGQKKREKEREQRVCSDGKLCMIEQDTMHGVKREERNRIKRFGI